MKPKVLTKDRHTEAQLTEDLRERMITLIRVIGTEDYGRYTWLAKRTGVPAQKWANLFNRRQQPTVEMIQAVSKLDSRYTEWLVTGEAPARFPENPFDGVNSRLNLTLHFNASIRRSLYLQAADDERAHWESDLAGSKEGHERYADQIGANGLKNVEERLRKSVTPSPQLPTGEPGKAPHQENQRDGD
ncbi:hypothetical protein L602_000100001050 [Cupriavidus gilardii J11]|uniref:Uncharacterized protein n=1 Tax=Cupriavidus gilardii J11 TaxID=936133 RepID=A0A562BVE6_9BURK|nr:hypothetical protein [Cupriavidus gilardii]TWG89215.1 hypothetical protein L602_000100001050 [Cupriavidus gilardii J11]